MKLTDIARAQYPDGAVTVEELLDKFVKKPASKGIQLSSTDILKHLGWATPTIRQAKRASAWLKLHGFQNVNDNWCWRVELETPLTPHFVV